MTQVGNDSGLTAALSMENRCIRYSQEVDSQDLFTDSREGETKKESSMTPGFQA